MTTTQTHSKGLYTLEKQINAHLATLPPERRPEAVTRSRIQRVDYMARGAFQATDSNGNVDTITAECAALFLAL